MGSRGRNEHRVNCSAPAGAEPPPGATARAPDPAEDDFLAHVQRVMGPVPAGPARRGPAPADAPPARGAPARAGKQSAAGASKACRLRCVQCGWAVECLEADADRFVRAGCLQCRSAVVRAADRPAADPASRRQARRRRPRGTGWVEVRAWAGDWGPDLALAVADVGEDGLGVWLSAPVRPGQAVRVVVVRPAGASPAPVPAEVRWCAPAADWTYRAGLRLSRPLDAEELDALAL